MIRGSQPDLEEDEGVAVADGGAVEAEERGAPQSFQPSSHAHKALAHGFGELQAALKEVENVLEADEASGRGCRIVNQQIADVHRGVGRLQRHK